MESHFTLSIKFQKITRGKLSIFIKFWSNKEKSQGVAFLSNVGNKFEKNVVKFPKMASVLMTSVPTSIQSITFNLRLGEKKVNKFINQ